MRRIILSALSLILTLTVFMQPNFAMAAEGGDEQEDSEAQTAELAGMSLQEIQDRIEIRELTDRFANLADTKEVDKQVELFVPDGTLEFQMGFDGEINEIKGREAL